VVGHGDVKRWLPSPPLSGRAVYILVSCSPAIMQGTEACCEAGHADHHQSVAENRSGFSLPLRWSTSLTWIVRGASGLGVFFT
jgi:hypothetical protein